MTTFKKTRSMRYYDRALYVLMWGWLITFVKLINRIESFTSLESLTETQFVKVTLTTLTLIMMIVLATRQYSAILDDQAPNPLWLGGSGIILLVVPAILEMLQLLKPDDPLRWLYWVGPIHCLLALYGIWAYYVLPDRKEQKKRREFI